jgi:hypothetical protein
MTTRAPVQSFSPGAKVALETMRAHRKTVKMAMGGKDDLAQSVVTFFSFDMPELINFGPSYNQVARDLYDRACAKVRARK